MGNAHQDASDSNINVGMGLLINLPKYTDAIATLVPSDKRKRWGPHVSPIASKGFKRRSARKSPQSGANFMGKFSVKQSDLPLGSRRGTEPFIMGASGQNPQQIGGKWVHMTFVNLAGYGR